MRGARRRWWLALGASAAIVAGAGLLVLPRYVSSRAVEAAKRRGIELTVGSVGLGFGRVQLRNLEARLEGVPDLRTTVRRASVSWSLAGTGDVEVEGLDIDARGSVDELRDAVEAWRARHRSSEGGGGGAGRRLVVREVTARWSRLGIQLASAAVAEVALEPATVRIRGASAQAKLLDLEVKVEGASTEIVRATGKIGSSSIDKLRVELGPLMAAAAPVAALDAKDAKPASASVAPAAHEATKPEDPWARLASAHARLASIVDRFDVGVELRVVELLVATERETLGPWGARAILGETSWSFELDPGEKAGRKPLVLRALVPRGQGKWSAELKVGPATLSELGLPEGTFGLVEIDKAAVEARGALELDPQLKTFAADGSIQLKNASLSNARIADGVVRSIEISGKGIVASKDDLSAWSLTGGALELGKVRLEVEGGFERRTGPGGVASPKVWMAWSVPEVSCGDALASMPKGLLARLDGMSMQGTFGAHGRLAFDAKAPEKTEVDLSLEQKCRVTKVPPQLSLDRFRQPFELRVYDPKGNPKMQTFGPGTPEWVSLDRISPYVVDAVLTCEDAAFFGHKGFSAVSIRNALIANIKSGKFALGASTVTMQLAKNIFLERRKQLARKLEEAVLTAWLEQGMSKSELLELYLNVIEYGPNLYGIGPAAMHYFGRPARDLDPLEAMFLVSILPSPVKRHVMWEKGQIGDAYLKYLRFLLKEAHARGKLEDDEYEAAATRPFTFHKPGDPPPAPHSPPSGKSSIEKNDGDPAYDPVWAPPPE